MKNRLIRSAFCLLTFGCTLASGPALSQNRLSEQAMNCSAVFDIFSEVYAGEAALHGKFRQAVDLFTDVYLKESAVQARDMQEAVKRRISTVQEFRQTWASRAPAFSENAVICGAWAEGFWVQGERYQFVPVYPKVVMPPIRRQYQEHADQVLKRWQP